MRDEDEDSISALFEIGDFASGTGADGVAPHDHGAAARCIGDEDDDEDDPVVASTRIVRAAPARSASTNTIAPAAATTSCAPDTRVENDSMGAACMMSSAPANILA